MANLIIDEQLAERLAQVAERQHKPVEDVLREAVDLLEAKAADSLTPEQQMYRKIYSIARRYWREHNNADRLALTDEQLDEQFWLIDPDGIPRLKSEEGTFYLPPDPLESMIGMIKDGPSDLSQTVRETMAEVYRAKYDRLV